MCMQLEWQSLNRLRCIHKFAKLFNQVKDVQIKVMRSLQIWLQIGLTR